jgi:isoleucyl-tRNA synthetase
VTTASTSRLVERRRGRDLVGWAYRAPFADLPAAAGVDHRVIPWDDVQISEGTGVVHVAPGCGTEDFALGRRLDLPTLAPVGEDGTYTQAWGWLAGRRHDDVTGDILSSLRARDLLVSAGTIVHRYPECWRCHTPLIYRVSDDWFIAVDGVRAAMRKANAAVEWTPAYLGKRMDDWLVNMGDWNISRRRYYGLPLPFYLCDCGHLTVVGSRAELGDLATGPLDGLVELRRPWIDDVTIRCPACAGDVQRVPEVGDVWLDAGIVPFSTLGWQNPTTVPSGLATGAAAGLTAADLPDHDTWEQWFPADWVSEMREQIRLWFYAQLFISVVLVGKAPYRRVLGYEKLLDETGREMHGSWGNMILAEDAFTTLGADTMRWLYCAQPSTQDLLFGYTNGRLVQRKLLTLWNSVQFLIQNTTTNAVLPALAGVSLGSHAPTNGLDRWLVERTHDLVDATQAAYDSYRSSDVVMAVDSYLDDLSNWYIRLSRRRFWDGDLDAHRTLFVAVTTVLQVMAPVTPFLAEYLWQRLVRPTTGDAPTSIFLAGWPDGRRADRKLLEEMGTARRVVELGRQARATSRHRTRQPLRRAVVAGVGDHLEFADLVQDELRVKDLVVGEIGHDTSSIKLNYRRLGRRLGPKMQAVADAVAAGDYTDQPDGSVLVAGERLDGEDIQRQTSTPAGWSVARLQEITVALDTRLDDDLVREGRANDLIRLVNTARKEAGLDPADRIRLWLDPAHADLTAHLDTIAQEVLAVDVSFGHEDGDRPAPPFSFRRVTGDRPPSERETAGVDPAGREPPERTGA